MRQRLIRVWETTVAVLSWGLFAFVMSLALTRDTYQVRDALGRVLPYVRDQEFDFFDWTVGAVGWKLRQASVDEQVFLGAANRAQLVRDYFTLVGELEEVERAVAAKFADPAVKDPAAATADLRSREAQLQARARQLQPAAEAVLQEQISVILAETGLVVGGQPIPPVAFHFTPLPLALIVSPRDIIRQEVNVDVSGGLTLEQQAALEDRVARGLDVSTLIVPLGGIGTYPTMVMRSSNLNWIASVTAHEWAHNYLTLRPLGLNYETTPELRTMNETTAETAGNEIGALVMQRFYPDLAAPAPPFPNVLARELPPEAPDAPAFDFRAEMHATRVQTDALLAAGKIEAAESYMEQRRRFFWDHGYQIRKLNQAYFAFYGAYAADAGGAPGADPVGPAVRLLRRRSPSLRAFVDTMAGFTSFAQLKDYLGLEP